MDVNPLLQTCKEKFFESCNALSILFMEWEKNNVPKIHDVDEDFVVEVFERLLSIIKDHHYETKQVLLICLYKLLQTLPVRKHFLQLNNIQLRKELLYRISFTLDQSNLPEYFYPNTTPTLQKIMTRTLHIYKDKFYDIWNDDSVTLPKPIEKWKRYDCIERVYKLGYQDEQQVYLVKMYLYENVFIYAVVKYGLMNEEMVIARRLARNDGKNFLIKNPYVFSSSLPEINSGRGLITSLGFTVDDVTRKIGLLFPVYECNLRELPASDVTSELRKNIFTSVVSGLKVLHSWGYRHNDVKLENIFYSKCRNEVVLADFGVCDTGKRQLYFSQSNLYRPVVDGEKYTKKTDIYALAVLYETLTQKRKDGTSLCIFYKNKEEKRLFLECENYRDVFEESEITFERSQDSWWMDENVLQLMKSRLPERRPSSWDLCKIFCAGVPRFPRYSFVLLDVDVSYLRSRIFSDSRMVKLLLEQCKIDIYVLEQLICLLRILNKLPY